MTSRQGPRGLRLEQASPGSLLPRPTHSDAMEIDEREIRPHRGELTHLGRIQCACMKLEQRYRAAEMALAAQVRQRFGREPQNRGNAL